MKYISCFVFIFLVIFLMSGIAFSKNKNDQIRKEVLAAYNKYSAKSNIPPLSWSKKLETHAKEWAVYLALPEGRLYHSKSSGEGETL
jgi:uncharacterized protein YkwD